MSSRRPGEEPVRHRRSVVVLIFTILSAALGCEQEEPAGERYIARLSLTREPNWQLESVANPQPQKAPWNVIWEVTRFLDALPTQNQQRMADQLYEDSRASADRNGWFEYEQGIADGYTLTAGDVGSHYVNYDFVFDDVFLDPERPEFLMYFDTPGGKILGGFMFMVPIGEEGPQIGGPLTIWHFHIFAGHTCILRGRIAIGRAENGECEKGEPFPKSPEMIHVWLQDHPGGRFASPMNIPRKSLRPLGGTSSAEVE